jgi:hypothetical protein
MKAYLSFLFVISYLFSSLVMAQNNLPETLRDIVTSGTGSTSQSHLAETLGDTVAPGSKSKGRK